LPVIETRPSLPFLAGIALACAIPALAACDRQSDGAGQPEASPAAKETPDASPQAGKIDTTHNGEAIPDIAIALPDGTSKSLAAFKGKPLLVNLWATWCGPCVLEMPMLDGLAARHPDIQVLTVSQDMEGAAKVEPWFAERKFAHLQPWLDPKNDLTFGFKTGVLPTTVYYDADGKEVWRVVGEYDWSGPDAEALLAQGKAR